MVRRQSQGLLGCHTVGALAIVAWFGNDAQTHLLFECAAEEAAHRMSLPTGGLPKFPECCAAGSSEQGENLGRLGPWPGRGGLGIAYWLAGAVYPFEGRLGGTSFGSGGLGRCPPSGFF
jgi:hypothetical protein